MIDLVFLEGVVEDPDAVFEEGEVGNFVGVEVEGEPEVFVGVELEDHFEEGTRLEQLVADDVFELTQDLEEVVVAHLGVPADVLESVNDLCLQLYQGLDGHLVDLFKGFPVDVLEVLSLELFDQLRVRVLQVGFTDGAVLI